MQTFSTFKYPLGCAVIVMVIVNFWATIPLQLFEPEFELFQEQMLQEEPRNETVSEKMNRKRKILERGCSMMAILYEMSQNGTPYETLLAWHAKIHDLPKVSFLMKKDLLIILILGMRPTIKENLGDFTKKLRYKVVYKFLKLKKNQIVH